METKGTKQKYFSWKYVLFASLLFFVLIMLFEYLLDRKEYPTINALIRENAIKKAIAAIAFGATMGYFRAKQLKKDEAGN